MVERTLFTAFRGNRKRWALCILLSQPPCKCSYLTVSRTLFDCNPLVQTGLNNEFSLLQEPLPQLESVPAHG
jgi:hypothetical protein